MTTSNSDLVFTIYDSAGAPLAGLTPTWTTFKDVIAGTDYTPQPTVAEIGLGMYSVPLVTIVGMRLAGILDFGATANPRYITYDSPGPTVSNPTPPPTSAATSLSLAQLILAVRQRADMEHSTFVADTELTSYINQSLFELYDLLVEKYGADYYTDSSTITTDGTNERFAMPATLYKLMGVDLLISGGNSYITLKPFMMSERNRFTFANTQATFGTLSNLRYRMSGGYLWLTPKPAAGQTLRIWFVPRMAPLADPSDEFDGFSGWTEYVIVDAAIKCLQKEESDCGLLMAQKEGLIKRIEVAAADRDVGSPKRVADTQSVDAWMPGDMSSHWGY